MESKERILWKNCFGRAKGNTRGEEPTYQVIDNGSWSYDIPYGTIHRVASSGKAKGKAETDVENLNIVATYNAVHGSPISFVQYGLGYFLTTRDLLEPTLDYDICFLPLKPKLTTELALV